MPLRGKRRELKRVEDFEVTLVLVLGMIRDRMLALPDRVQELSPARLMTHSAVR